jgi:hypothetical protein
LPGPLGSLVSWLVRAVIFVNDVARQPPVFGDGESLLLGPGAYLAAALATRCRSHPRMRPAAQDQTRMFHKRRKLTAEFARVPVIQVELIVPAIDPEPNGLVRRSARQVIFKAHFNPLHHNPPSYRLRLPAGP